MLQKHYSLYLLSCRLLPVHITMTSYKIVGLSNFPRLSVPAFFCIFMTCCANLFIYRYMNPAFRSEFKKCLIPEMCDNFKLQNYVRHKFLPKTSHALKIFRTSRTYSILNVGLRKRCQSNIPSISIQNY